MMGLFIGALALGGATILLVVILFAAFLAFLEAIWRATKP